MGVLALAGFCLSACNHELDIQQAYPFTVETMPVQKHIVKGQTAEIRCTLKRQGWFEDARYTIRYFYIININSTRFWYNIIFTCLI